MEPFHKKLPNRFAECSELVFGRRGKEHYGDHRVISEPQFFQNDINRWHSAPSVFCYADVAERLIASANSSRFFYSLEFPWRTSTDSVRSEGQVDRLV